MGIGLNHAFDNDEANALDNERLSNGISMERQQNFIRPFGLRDVTYA